MRCTQHGCSQKAIKGFKSCIGCVQRRKRWRDANVEKIRISEKESKHRVRMAALAKLGNCCILCGFNDWRALQIDHLFGGGRAECRKLGADGIQRKIILMSNPETEYQCLCANCNWIKRYDKGEHNAIR